MTTYRLINYDTAEVCETACEVAHYACQRLYRRADGQWRESGYRATLTLTNLVTGETVATWSPLDRPLYTAIALPTVHRVARALREPWDELLVRDLARLDDEPYRSRVAEFPKMILDNLIESRQYFGV